MGAWQGFVLAFTAAFSHSCIDSLRKVASKRFDTTQCVCLVALLEGSLSFAFVAGQVSSSSGPALQERSHVPGTDMYIRACAGYLVSAR